jgi:hypothetical protein
LTTLGSQADLLLAKKELLQLMNLTTAASAFDIQRNVLDKERLRTELMQQKVALASAEVSLQNLENEWYRARIYMIRSFCPIASTTWLKKIIWLLVLR